jgi:hypothetical protein
MWTAIERIIFIAVATAIGGFVGLTCLGDVILVEFHGYDHGFGETAKSELTGGIIGACIGAVAAWRFIGRKPPRSL